MTNLEQTVVEQDLRNLEELVEASGNLPPEAPSLSPPEWIRKNLFSSPFNSLLTVIFGLFALWAFRAMLAFTFSPIRVWRAPATNARLMLAGVYPESQFVRIWVLLALTMGLAGLSMGIVRAGSPLSLKRISIWVMTTGTFLVACVLLTPTSWNLVNEDGSPIPNESFGTVMSRRIWPWLVLALIVLGIGLAMWFGLGEIRRRSTFVPSVGVIFGALIAAVGSLWVVPYGHYALADGVYISEPGRTVAMSTKVPFTVCLLIMLAMFVVGRALAGRVSYVPSRFALGLVWTLLPLIGIFVILRDPAFDYGYVMSVDVPLFLAFAVMGSAILWFLTGPSLGEVGRIIATGFLLLAVFNWVAAFFGWYPMLQKVRFSFLLFALVALVAHNFAGDRATRVRFITGWLGALSILHYFATVINTPRTIDLVQEQFMMGLVLTLMVAALSTLASFPLGMILALGRTSEMPIFRQLSTLYIEFVRGVPLLAILFFVANILPLFLPDGMNVAEVAVVVAGFAFFSAAYLAENVRGGLQSIRRGQFEAADALGLTTGMRTSFIILPQALRASIPQLVGQAIAGFKETSLILIIGSLDFLLIARSTIPNQTEFFGNKKEGLLVVSAVYFLGAFAMSKYSQKMERRLGVGER